MKNPKQKGTDFELVIAKRLSRWYDPNSKIDYFWRTHSSGAVATIRKSMCEVMEGDIMSIREETHELFNYIVIECKRMRTLDLMSFLDRKACDILSLYEVSRVKLSQNKFLLLVVKRDYGEILVLTSLLLPKISKYMKINNNGHASLYLYKLEDMLSTYTFNEFLRNVKEEFTPDRSSLQVV